jgi:hypothetical protein
MKCFSTLYWTLKRARRSRGTRLNIAPALDLNLAHHEYTLESIKFEVNYRNIFNQTEKNNNYNANVNFNGSVWCIEMY